VLCRSEANIEKNRLVPSLLARSKAWTLTIPPCGLLGGLNRSIDHTLLEPDMFERVLVCDAGPRDRARQTDRGSMRPRWQNSTAIGVLRDGVGVARSASQLPAGSPAQHGDMDVACAARRTWRVA